MHSQFLWRARRKPLSPTCRLAKKVTYEHASLAAVMPMGGSYGVSKHGVLALTEGVQVELEQRGASCGRECCVRAC